MDVAMMTRPHGPSTVVSPTGQLDLAGAPALRSALIKALAEGDGVPSVVVDLTAVEFLDSSTLGVLVSARNRAVAAGGTLSVVVSNPLVLRILTITGLMQVLDVRPTLDDTAPRLPEARRPTPASVAL